MQEKREIPILMGKGGKTMKAKKRNTFKLLEHIKLIKDLKHKILNSDFHS